MVVGRRSIPNPTSSTLHGTISTGFQPKSRGPSPAVRVLPPLTSSGGPLGSQAHSMELEPHTRAGSASTHRTPSKEPREGTRIGWRSGSLHVLDTPKGRGR
jgi:hypothetical protein